MMAGERGREEGEKCVCVGGGRGDERIQAGVHSLLFRTSFLLLAMSRF